jgi:EAL domain-containing protein (putative c-di-GMP-specific phosphodiesterase class I)
VESRDVVELLRDKGCDAAQGYFFAKAMPMEDLLSQLGKRNIAA